MTSSAVLTPDTAGEPLLRTLAPALRQLERKLRDWLDAPHLYSLPTLARATFEGLDADLRRQADTLDVDRPLLVVMLMGGTGVGKSTLLNALAGGAIAAASFARPTTLDPVVYYHESVNPDRLDPSLRHCRLVPHNRPALEQKILVDTPDMDTNVLANRHKLLELLPVADVILYVGSQEKYHDKLGWELFLQQRRRRAFAFVLNKWDRCRHAGAAGLRPDEDLIRDLQAEGFASPLLFRTCAQLWLDRANGDSDATFPEGEQFSELAHWLELGLNRLEIEAIKARGISQLLNQLADALEKACPPDLTEAARRTQGVWEKVLAEEATATADVLLHTLAPYQREIEHHFTLESQKRFRGIMGNYLSLVTRTRYLGTTLRDRIPFLPRPSQTVETPAAWDLAAFTRACISSAGERHLDARGRALSNRLLIEAKQQGFPLDLLSGTVEATAHIDWRQRLAQDLAEVLQNVEQHWANPSGTRRWLQGIIVFLADWLPHVAVLAALARFLWLYFMVSTYKVELIDVLLPVIVLLVVLICLHLVIALVLPLRWSSIRGEFQRELERRLQVEVVSAYAPIPGAVAESLQRERQQVEHFLGDTREVSAWLDQREKAASIGSLYGSES